MKLTTFFIKSRNVLSKNKLLSQSVNIDYEKFKL